MMALGARVLQVRVDGAHNRLAQVVEAVARVPAARVAAPGVEGAGEGVVKGEAEHVQAVYLRRGD